MLAYSLLGGLGVVDFDDYWLGAAEVGERWGRRDENSPEDATLPYSGSCVDDGIEYGVVSRSLAVVWW